MGEAVAPVDAEKAAVAYLKAQFSARGETATVATKVPTTEPARMVRVSLIGSTELSRLHSYSRLLFECWAPTEPAASALARTAYALMRACEGAPAGDVFINDVVTVGGPANNPSETGPRYQFTLDLLAAGDVI